MRQLLMALILAGLLVSGCAVGSTHGHNYGLRAMPATLVVPPPGLIFEQISAPLTPVYEQTPVEGKVGQASYQFFSLPFTYDLISFSWQDPPSLEQAAALGGLRTVAYADYKVLSVLGVYTRFTIIAHGQ